MQKIIGAMTTPKPHHVVLGAGLMGRLLACALAEEGHRVSLYDAGSPDGNLSAARVAAAMLAPLAESAISELPIVKMGQYGLKRWPELLCRLPEPVFFQQEGTLIVWHRQDAFEAARFSRQMEASWKQVDGLAAAQTLSAAQIQQLEPALGLRFAQGLHLPGEGQLDNRALLNALLARLAVLKVAIHWNSPREPKDFLIAPQGDVLGLFDCRGLGARPQIPGLRGVRGEVIRVHAPEVELKRPVRLIHPRYPLYVAPKPDHVFVIGATEIESDDMSAASVRSTLELLSAAYSLHSGFAEARILEISSQCRPALLDNLPTVRQVAPGSWQINGLYRHGFLIAPALLDVVMQLVKSGASTLAGEFSLALGDRV